MKIMTKDEIERSEQLFQEYLTRYTNDHTNKDAWNNMWRLVQSCCSNIAKSKLKGVVCPDFDGKVTDATIVVMKKIKLGAKPEKLSSFCYFPVIGIIYNKKLQNEERTLSFEGLYEDQGDATFCDQTY